MEYPNNAPEAPLVSVCIQTYNHAPYIAQCIEGVLMQETDFPFEIIIGEDESTDGTREICIEYAKKYPEKIRLFLRREEDKIWINGVKTGRFNFVENLKAARGKYIALCDGDDYWVDKEKLQYQTSFLENQPSHQGCFHNVINRNEKENTEKPRYYFKNEFDLTPNELAKGNIIITSSFFFRKSAINDLPTWYKKLSIGDWGLFLFINEKGRIKFLNNIFGVYRIHQNGFWSSLNKKQHSRKGIQVVNELDKHFKYRYKNSFDHARLEYKKIRGDNFIEASKKKVKKLIKKLLYL